MKGIEQALVDLDQEYTDVIKPYYERRAMALAEAETELGVGHHFQAPDGTVFETVVPDSKMVTMEHFGVKRTARDGESGSGKLSKKRATELGYTV